MKAYFVASLSQKDDYKDNYKNIINTLQEEDVIIESKHITESSLEEVSTQSDEERLAFYKKFLKNISSADIVVAEVSYPSSLGVGSAVSIALEKSKPVIALYKVDREPLFLKGLGLEDDKLLMYEYGDEKDLIWSIKKGLKKVKSIQDIRFNFFISPKISNYLDWVSKKKRIPRSVYLRRLIEEDMREQEEFGE